MDAAGRRTNLSLWNHPGNDIYGMIARSERMVNAVEQLLGDEVYHYHSKLSAKQPRVGGAWEWHQDYGYWYKNGCLFPDMLSVFIAVDPCTKENGCMQVLRGSHLMGRIEHGFTPLSMAKLTLRSSPKLALTAAATRTFRLSVSRWALRGSILSCSPLDDWAASAQLAASWRAAASRPSVATKAGQSRISPPTRPAEACGFGAGTAAGVCAGA